MKKLEKVTDNGTAFFHFSRKLKNYLINMTDWPTKSLSGGYGGGWGRQKQVTTAKDISKGEF